MHGLRVAAHLAREGDYCRFSSFMEAPPCTLAPLLLPFTLAPPCTLVPRCCTVAPLPDCTLAPPCTLAPLPVVLRLRNCVRPLGSTLLPVVLRLRNWVRPLGATPVVVDERERIVVWLRLV